MEPPPQSVLKVSVPLDVLSFNVSLPISAVVNAPAQSLKALQDRLVGARALPAGMYQFSIFVYLNSVYYSNRCISIEGWVDVSHLEGPESHAPCPLPVSMRVFTSSRSNPLRSSSAGLHLDAVLLWATGPSQQMPGVGPCTIPTGLSGSGYRPPEGDKRQPGVQREF